MVTKVEVAKYTIFKVSEKLREKASSQALQDFWEEYKLKSDEEYSSDEISEIQAYVDYLNDFDSESEAIRTGKHKITELSILKNPKIHIDWFQKWLENTPERYYWTQQKLNLKYQFEKRRFPGNEAKDIIESLDRSSENILRELEDPKRAHFSSKGLVLGYVQSGKTANFSALIAKAADAGYKFFIVLGGIHNVLRSQTQLRLDQEVTGHSDNYEQRDDFVKITNKDWLWHRITNYEDQTIDPRAKGDFTQKGISSFNHFFEYDTRPVLAVVKKNCTVLDSLIKWIEKGSNELKSRVPVLIIDDEADQASIDTNANRKYIGSKESDPAQTNKRIRKLLSLFHRRAYIGYTATPFANLLIGKDAFHTEFGEDLYPRNFIASLPKPDKYFGPSRLFSEDLKSQFIKLIEDERTEIKFEMPPPAGLEEAIMVFTLSCAIRSYRGDASKPMSMLVHIDQKTVNQTIAFDVVSTLFKAIKTEMQTKKGEKDLINRFRVIYTEDYHYKEAQRNSFVKDCEIINKELHKQIDENLLPLFNELIPLIKEALENIEMLELNSKSEDRLDYRSKKSLKVIAIGGNVLSRGLTLEGLMTSYYLRSTLQSDTLLQMGRWFGYRNNYEDLVRIYTTEEISSSYEKMALLEEMVRDQIDQYVYDEVTPADLPVMMKVFEKLKITSKSKIGAGILKQAFSDTVAGTIWFPLDEPEKLIANLEGGEMLADEIGKSGIKPKGGKNDKFLFEGVPHILVQDFISNYKYIDPSKIRGAGMDHEGLLAYIIRRSDAGEFNKWNVLFANPLKGADPENTPINWGRLNGLARVERSRLSKYDTRNGLFNVGVLSSPSDLKADLKRGAKDAHDGREKCQPLIVIYRIWSGSKGTGVNRIDLFHGFREDKKYDVVGYSVVLPESQDKSEKEEHIVQIFTK